MLQLIVFFLLLTSRIFTSEQNTFPPIFVSLGANCDVASKLQDNALRSAAFPFDWLLTTNHDRLPILLDDDFAFFLDKSVIYRHPENPMILENAYYEIEFRHDPSENPEANLDEHLKEVALKYERRIARFRRLGEYPGKVFFIRAADNTEVHSHYWSRPGQNIITSEQAEKLRGALDRYFPKLDFQLIIFNFKEETTLKIENIKGVTEFKIRKSHRELDYAPCLRRLSRITRSFCTY